MWALDLIQILSGNCAVPVGADATKVASAVQTPEAAVEGTVLSRSAFAHHSQCIGDIHAYNL